MISGPFIRHIVFATDFSESAASAQEYAVSVAKACDAKLWIIHVVESPLWFEPDAAMALYLQHVQMEADQQLAAIEKQLAERKLTALELRHRTGMPSAQIDKFAQEVGADLVVVGTRGRNRLETILLGSTAERVIKAAPCPVFAIPTIGSTGEEKELAFRPRFSIQHILTPLDFSSPSLDAIEYAIQVARQFGARMTLLHVLEPMYYDGEAGLRSMDLLRSVEREVQSAEQRWQQWAYWRPQLEKLTGLVESIGMPARSIVAGGVPADSIVQCAKEQDCDLIVMGTHGRRGLSRLRFGSVAESVLRQSPYPVLTVKSPKFAAGHRRVTPQEIADSK